MNKLNYEILNMIDDIEESTYQAEQAVFSSMIDEYKKSMMLLEYVEPEVYDEIIYQESKFSEKFSKGINKAKRVLSAIWEGIKKAFGLIVRGIGFVINKLISLFRKSKKTASQVAESVVGPDPQSRISGPNADIKLIEMKDDKVQMPVDPHSAIMPEPVKISPVEGLISKFAEDGSVEISTNFGTEYLKNMVRSGKQKGSELNAKMLAVRDFGSIVVLHIMMYDNNIREKFFNVFKEFSEIINFINNKSLSDDEESGYGEKLKNIVNDYVKNVQDVSEVVMVRGGNNLSKMNDFVNDFGSSTRSDENYAQYNARLNAAYNDRFMKPLKFKLKDIQLFSKQLNELNSKYVQPVKLREGVELKLYDFDFEMYIQSVLNFVNEAQYSINAIMNLVSNSFTIDKSYFKTINEPEKLDEFVGALIDAGIPARYIGYNAWLISGENITSDSEFKPRWGQTRLCLLPNDNDICYKIALNGLGKSGNATEYKVYNELLKDCKILCPCLKMYKTQSVVMSKRAEFIEASQSEKRSVIADINDELYELTKNKSVKIVDVHGDNIGIVDGRNVVIDYGEIAWK